MQRWLLGHMQKLVGGSDWPWRLRYVLSMVLLRRLMPVGQVVEGYIGAYRVSFDLTDQIQQLAYLGFYEPIHVRLMKKLLCAGDVFFDVGANVGYYSLLASQLVGDTGSVHAFEPIAENVAALKRAIEQNRVSNIVVNEVAIGATNGVVTLFTDDTDVLGCSGHASAFSAENRTKQRMAQVTTLDEYVQSPDIPAVRLVKIDVEGMELDVVLGMKDLLSRPDAPDLFCETWEKSSRNVTTYLARHGYRIYASPFVKAQDPEQECRGIANLFCTKNSRRLEIPHGIVTRIGTLFER